MYRSKINPHDTSNETANDEPKTKLNRRRSSRISYSVMKAKKCQKFPPKNSSNKIVNRFHGKEEEEEAETETEEEEIQASPFPQPPPMDAVTFKDWQHETSQTLKSQPGGDPVSAKCPGLELKKKNNFNSTFQLAQNSTLVLGFRRVCLVKKHIST